MGSFLLGKMDLKLESFGSTLVGKLVWEAGVDAGVGTGVGTCVGAATAASVSVDEISRFNDRFSEIRLEL